MPEKDGSDDKKSTKSVVNKKQKQFTNKEQLDLTSVAESFGGQIVGEPVDLTEFVVSGSLATATAVKTMPIWLPKLINTVGALGLTYAGWRQRQNQKQNNVIKPTDTKTDDTKTDTDTASNTIKGFKPTPYNPTGFEPSTEIKKELEKRKKELNKKQVIVQPSDETDTKDDTKTDTKDDTKTDTSTAVLPLPVLNKTRTRTRTRTRTGTKGGIPKLPKMPGTGHNVGRRVNPQ